VDALEQIKTNRPHLLITDIRMPAMDGIMLIKTIRELGIPIKIIILSGYSDFSFLKKAIRLGDEKGKSIRVYTYSRSRVS